MGQVKLFLSSDSLGPVVSEIVSQTSSNLFSIGIGIGLSSLAAYLAEKKNSSGKVRAIARILGVNVNEINRSIVLEKIKDPKYRDKLENNIQRVSSSKDVEELANFLQLSQSEAWEIYRYIKEILLDSEIHEMLSEVLGEITESQKVIENLNNQFDTLSKSFNDTYEKLRNAISRSVEEALTVKSLESYYEVIRDHRINLRTSTLCKLKNTIRCWNQGQQASKIKPILLVTGDPGVGKSWLTCRALGELLEEGAKVYKVISSENIDVHIFKSNEDIEGEEDPNENNQGIRLFVLDDRYISTERISTGLDTKAISRIIKNYLPTGSDRILSGPLIISIREENWSYLYDKLVNEEKLDETSLNELITRFEVHHLNEEEAERLIDSFYSVIDNANPPYPNLKVTNEYVKKTMITKSGGIPAIIKLFFDQKAKQALGREYTITEVDAEQIISNAKFYVLDQVFNYYLNALSNNIEKVPFTLAFLYFIVSGGPISIAHVKILGKSHIKNLHSSTLEQINALNIERSLPLFNNTDEGLLIPFHDSIREAIVGLVENPDLIEEELTGKSEVISSIPVGKLSKLRNETKRIIEFDVSEPIKDISINSFFDRYSVSVAEAIDRYLGFWKRQLNRGRKVNEEYVFSTLSILVEALPYYWISDYSSIYETSKILSGQKYQGVWGIQYPLDSDTTGKQIESTKFNASTFEEFYLNKSISQAKFIEIKCAIEESPYSSINFVYLENKILRQMYSIFDRIGWDNLDYNKGHLYFLKLFFASRQNEFEIDRIWPAIQKMVSNNILNYKEIQEVKAYLINILANAKAGSKSKLSIANSLLDLVNSGKIDHSDRDVFMNLLVNKEIPIRIWGWSSVVNLVNRKVLSTPDVKCVKVSFLELLGYKGEMDKQDMVMIWTDILPELIRYNILSPKDTLHHKKQFLEYLVLEDPKIRYIAWKKGVISLMDCGVLSGGEVMQRRRRLIHLLKHNYSWREFIHLMDRWILLDEDIQDVKRAHHAYHNESWLSEHIYQ